MFKLDLEKAEEPEIKLPTSVGSSKKQGNSRETSTSASLTKVFDCMDHNKLWKILKEMALNLPPEKPVCWSTSKIRTTHGITVWLKIEQEVHQGCILSPCLFNLYAEYIM